jgi:DNA invertase Pin-like site-specific DNA recombinase
VLKLGIDTSTAQGHLVFHVLGAIDEFQRELIVEGTLDRPRNGAASSLQRRTVA